MKSMIAVIALLCAAMSTDASSTCIPVNGLTFEKVGDFTLMMIQNGNNFGLVKIYDIIPNNFSVRFFTPTICDDYGGNSKFHINVKLAQIK